MNRESPKVTPQETVDDYREYVYDEAAKTTAMLEAMKAMGAVETSEGVWELQASEEQIALLQETIVENQKPKDISIGCNVAHVDWGMGPYRGSGLEAIMFDDAADFTHHDMRTLRDGVKSKESASTVPANRAGRRKQSQKSFKSQYWK